MLNKNTFSYCNFLSAHAALVHFAFAHAVTAAAASVTVVTADVIVRNFFPFVDAPIQYSQFVPQQEQQLNQVCKHIDVLILSCHHPYHHHNQLSFIK